MSDIIKVGDQFYVLATSALADDRTRVIKEGETFAIFDRYGDIKPIGRGEQGLYHEGTRFLSRLEVKLGGKEPMLLGSTVLERNSVLTADLTNADIATADGRLTTRGTVHLFRQKFLWKGVCFGRFRINNHGVHNIEIPFEVFFGSDFVDIFEVRGVKRERRGRVLPPEVGADGVRLSYEGLDGVLRTLSVECSPAPERIDGSSLAYRFLLVPHEYIEFSLSFRCRVGERRPAAVSFNEAAEKVDEKIEQEHRKDCHVMTSNRGFNELVVRSLSDTHMLVTDTAHGPYPYAGIPWFSTAFGRDGIITAIETLWINPGIARGVLRYLADTQSDGDDPEKDAEPGKIMHETRHGEMAAAGEIPFGRYYGSVDSTPLFVMLAWRYYQYTADRGMMEDIWPNILRAVVWMDEYGDLDGDGFVEYMRRSKRGLANQGWKDSHDAISHADGSDAAPPIALCEEQGYVYAAKRHAAEVASLLGHGEIAEKLRKEARVLRQNFEKAFWCGDLGTYALALDGEKRQCRVRASNAGHCLYTRIASPSHARRVARTLMGEDMFSGWGVRTLSSSEVRYNPMSYHNGSIWPHDNAIIAAGMSYYGMKEYSCRVLTGLFDTSQFMDLKRLPELFCGFHKREDQGPTLYPVACSPQAWAAGAVFMLLKACMGLTVNAPRAQVRFDRPQLPEWLDQVRIEDLKVGRASVDIMLVRHEGDVSVNVLKRKGDVEILAVK